jgi:hypothetical protein
VVGLSLEPSAHAIVLGVEESSQIQALERTQRSRPHPGRCPPATSARSSDSPGPVEGVAGDRLGGGAAGLSTPQEVTPVKRSVPRGRPGRFDWWQMSPKKIRQRLRLRAPLLFFDQMVPIGG